jgi:hypothetical protein
VSVQKIKDPRHRLHEVPRELRVVALPRTGSGVRGSKLLGEVGG